MKYLVLAVLSSAVISILLRFGEDRVRNRIAMFLANYLVCILMSAFYMGGIPDLGGGSGIAVALGLGAIGGTLFLVNFLLYQYNIGRNGVVLSAVFMRLGVLVPVAMAVLVFREKPRFTQILGFALAVAAIVILNFRRGGSREAKRGSRLFLLILLAVAGITDSLANIYDKMGTSEAKDLYLMTIFFVASLICIGILLVNRAKLHPLDLLMGVLVGVPNYYSARFLLLALGEIPAIVTYPVYNVATIVVITLAGVLLFKERLNRRKKLGIALILMALVLLNL